jgi:hypothetical protein
MRACRQLAEIYKCWTCWLALVDAFAETDEKFGSSASALSAVERDELFVAITYHEAPPSVDTNTRALSRIVSPLPEPPGVWSQ